jgi:hypothetical protein
MAGMASRQRALLIEDWELTIADFENDRDEQGCLGPEATRLVHGGERLIQWLRGGPADPELRPFLEELLAAHDRDRDYEEIAGEHDVLAAAIEELH